MLQLVKPIGHSPMLGRIIEQNLRARGAGEVLALVVLTVHVLLRKRSRNDNGR